MAIEVDELVEVDFVVLSVGVHLGECVECHGVVILQCEFSREGASLGKRCRWR